MYILKGLFFFFFICCTQLAFAQHGAFVNENRVFQSHIKTVQCNDAAQEQSLPLIHLNSGEQLLFSFDDLQGGSKSYSYEVEHCRSDWQSSGLSPLDFVSNFSGDRIDDYKYASGTLQKYSHYSLSLPNEQVKFKISGNYILKVYEDVGHKTLVISQRFYVASNLALIKAEITTSPLVNQRNSHQKLNFSVSTMQLNVQHPERELLNVVMQNANPASTSINSRPSFVKPGIIQYHDPQSNIFNGGNEFRRLDLRARQNKNAKIEDISRNRVSYSSQFDANGKFLITNLDGGDPDTENDYTLVEFSLSATPPDTLGAIYVMGGLNQYNPNEAFKLTYNILRKKFEASALLKQGLYDYKYVWKALESDAVDDTQFEGSYFETANSYQILVYYRKPGSRWEELVGYLSIQTDTLPGAQ